MADPNVAARDGILITNRLFTARVAAGDATGLAALYTDDARLLPPGSEVTQGADNIVAYWQGAIDRGLSGVSLETIEVDNEGDTAIEIGHYHLTIADQAEAAMGKYLVVWKRIDDQWLIHRDIWNTTEAG